MSLDINFYKPGQQFIIPIDELNLAGLKIIERNKSHWIVLKDDRLVEHGGLSVLSFSENKKGIIGLSAHSSMDRSQVLSNISNYFGVIFADDYLNYLVYFHQPSQQDEKQKQLSSNAVVHVSGVITHD